MTKSHFILYVKDQARSTTFYTHVLNCQPTLNVPGMTEFNLSEDTILGLMPVSGIVRLLGDKLPDPTQGDGVPRNELYLLVDHPADYHQRALEAGAVELSPLEDRDWGDRAAYIASTPMVMSWRSQSRSNMVQSERFEMTLYKFCSFPDKVPHTYANAFAIEKTTGPDRLKIAPSSNHVDLLITLIENLPQPFGILYILLTPRGHSAQPGRYQSPKPSSKIEVQTFLRHFQTYLESDGRHHIWVISLPANSTLVYDNHNLLYAYGPLDQFKQILIQQGLTEQVIEIPVPHMHCYNQEFDLMEKEIMTYWNWRRFPLLKSDDD